MLAKKIRIVVGTSGIFEKEWIPTDYYYLNLLEEQDWNCFFSESSIDAILAEHVWEHLTFSEGEEAFKRCYRFLKKGGYLRVAVPDGYHPDKNYINAVQPNGTGAGADDHKVLYTYDVLHSTLEKIGYKITPLEYFDEHGVFHELKWLPADGMIHRSRYFDERNKNGKLNYTSIILDAVKQ